jgi:hypothetical protein
MKFNAYIVYREVKKIMSYIMIWIMSYIMIMSYIIHNVLHYDNVLHNKIG